MSSEDEILRLLEEQEQDLENRLGRVKAAIRALRNGAGAPVVLTPGSGKTAAVIREVVRPVILDIVAFLREKGTPQHQNEIIRTIGDRRREEYPLLRQHYSNIWRALEYHVRHDKLICCVHPDTGIVRELQPLPPRPKGTRTLPNDASLYLANNYFVLKEELVNGMLHIPASENREGASKGLKADWS